MTELANQVLPFVAAISLGLLAGALWAEDRLLLPYWRTLPADAFYELHPSYGPRLFRFFAPITIAAPFAALFSAIQLLIQSELVSARAIAASAAALLAWGLVAIYFLYFKAANDAFARHAVSADDLPATLARWASWHRARVVICIAAFAFSLVALAV